MCVQVPILAWHVDMCEHTHFWARLIICGPFKQSEPLYNSKGIKQMEPLSNPRVLIAMIWGVIVL